MIKIRVNSEMYAYDMYHMMKAFYPGMEVQQQVESESEILVGIQMDDGDEKSIAIHQDEVVNKATRKEKKQYVNIKVYQWASEISGQKLAWGTLTGVRPTKIMMGLLEQGMSEKDIIAYMQENYQVTGVKAGLGLEVAKREKVQLEQLDYKDGYSLYIGIPFCPTTCSYCSFTSYPIVEWKKRVDDYLDAVCKELTFIGSVSKEKKLNTVYIGGGTPTTLEPAQLDRLLTHIEENFSFANLKEFTVEAGRPDSITREKLAVLKQHDISRISINPQTMQQKTLAIIGRRHTVEDIERVYGLAREIGFDNINMDLIAGLPGETTVDMKDTLEKIQRMGPDSLTVHALAMKRASRLGQERKGKAINISENEKTARTLSEMIELAAGYAKEMNLVPYYLYRQKNIAGNFENVGYAKVDKAGIYNILIMEEKQSIIAVGAGASTKIVVPEEAIITDEKTGNQKKIVRIENVKDVEQYINRIDEMIERKGEWLWH